MTLKTSVSGNVYRETDKQMTARQEYRCARCGGKIAKGERYTRRNFMFYNGAHTDYFNGKLCSKCAEIKEASDGD